MTTEGPAGRAAHAADPQAGLLHLETVMGTTVTIDIRDTAVPVARLGQAVAAAVRVLHQADATFSTWRPDSPVSRLRRGQAAPVSARTQDLETVQHACSRARALTRGWFDPWAMPGGYDPTGLVKGWAAQQALRVLFSHGVRHALVNAGGDLAVIGSAGGAPDGSGWRVGITDPAAPGTVLLAVAVRDGAVATSGSYERGPLAIDPGTGRSVQRLRSATVIGPDLAMADACATAATAHGPAALGWLAAVPKVQALLVDLNGAQLTTPGWPGT